MIVAVVIAMIAMLIILIILSKIFYDAEKYDGRTKDDYIDIFRDNREDFEYVAEIIWQWPVRSRINIDGGISSDNPEIEDEILNNEELCRYLRNIYNLNEIEYIIVNENGIKFDFRIYPHNCYGGLYYVENSETAEDHYGAYKIDEHWVLYLIPGT